MEIPITLCCATLLAVSNTLLAGTIHVDEAPSGAGNNGSSWADAYTSLQDALAAASSGDEIWVAAGTYYPDEGGNESDDRVQSSFQLKTGVTIYGGYPSGGGVRDFAVNPSILSGNLQQNNNNSTNAYHVVKGSATDPTAILDGFTITKGYAYGSNSEKRRGAGLQNISGSPTITNCTFENNKAENHGGAVDNDLSSSPTFTNCSFAPTPQT